MLGLYVGNYYLIIIMIINETLTNARIFDILYLDFSDGRLLCVDFYAA